MTQEEKQLLLQYLCMALPYKVLVMVRDDEINEPVELLSISPKRDKPFEIDDGHDENSSTYWNFEDIKPYLRSMSSMTEEEKELLKKEHVKDEKLYLDAINGDGSMRGKVILHYAADWCNKNHFDFMGLIPKGLAIEITESNNPYEIML